MHQSRLPVVNASGLPPIWRPFCRPFWVGLVCAVLGTGMAGQVLAAGGKSPALTTPAAPMTNQVVDWPLGSPNAKVTLIEYGSLVCHHCAITNTQVLPEIKARYVTAGRVAFVYRAFPTEPAELAVGLHMLARCAGPQAYHGLVDAIYQRQDEILAASRQPNGSYSLVMEIVAKSGDMSAGAAAQCLRNGDEFDKVVSQAQEGERLGVQGTPTFFIQTAAGVKRVEGPPTLAALSAALDEALAQVPKSGMAKTGQARPARKAKQTTQSPKATPR